MAQPRPHWEPGISSAAPKTGQPTVAARSLWHAYWPSCVARLRRTRRRQSGQTQQLGRRDNASPLIRETGRVGRLRLPALTSACERVGSHASHAQIIRSGAASADCAGNPAAAQIGGSVRLAQSEGRSRSVEPAVSGGVPGLTDRCGVGGGRNWPGQAVTQSSDPVLAGVLRPHCGSGVVWETACWRSADQRCQADRRCWVSGVAAPVITAGDVGPAYLAPSALRAVSVS